MVQICFYLLHRTNHRTLWPLEFSLNSAPHFALVKINVHWEEQVCTKSHRFMYQGQGKLNLLHALYQYLSGVGRNP